jgi:aminoglycoside phosphotransferase
MHACPNFFIQRQKVKGQIMDHNIVTGQFRFQDLKLVEISLRTCFGH